MTPRTRRGLLETIPGVAKTSEVGYVFLMSVRKQSITFIIYGATLIPQALRFQPQSVYDLLPTSLAVGLTNCVVDTQLAKLR